MSLVMANLATAITDSWESFIFESNPHSFFFQVCNVPTFAKWLIELQGHSDSHEFGLIHLP